MGIDAKDVPVGEPAVLDVDSAELGEDTGYVRIEADDVPVGPTSVLDDTPVPGIE